MSFFSARSFIGLSILVIGVFRLASVLEAQVPATPSQASDPSPQSQSATYSAAEVEAERRKIWHSDDMLQARAWLEDHFRRSAQISDAQAKKYMAELEAMSPDQMRIWLINFNREHTRQVQEGKIFRQTNRLEVDHRLASPQVGGFANPYQGQGRASGGMPASGMRQSIGGQANPMAARPTVKKPFSDPSYQQSVRPLVTSEDAARWEIMRGLGGWR